MIEPSQLLPHDNPVATFLVLDPGVVAEGLRLVLEADDRVDVVGTASNCTELKNRLPAARPAVVLLDADLPHDETLNCCTALVESPDKPPVLLLANRLQPDLMLSALSMGASGFLLKSLSSKDLVDAIAHLASGGSLVSPKAVGSLLDTIRAPKTSSPIEVLTKLERDVLSALTSGATNRQIGRSLHLSEKTVKNYVSSILSKLGLRNRVEAAVSMTQLSARKFSEEPR